MFQNILVELITSLVGIFFGMLAALAVDRYNEQRRRRLRARIILRSLTQELTENFTTLHSVRSAYVANPFGKSFYVNTVAWETAVASGELPAIIGDHLTDSISDQYSLFVRIRYYVDLLTRLWFAPESIPGYAEKQRGFNQAIIEAMNKAVNSHEPLMNMIGRMTK